MSEAQRAVMRVLNDAVDALGLMVAAGACGCRTQDLSDALAGRPGRYVRIDWLLALMDVADVALRTRMAAALVGWAGMGVTVAKPLTAAERLARLEARVLVRFGSAGADLLEETRS